MTGNWETDLYAMCKRLGLRATVQGTKRAVSIHFARIGDTASFSGRAKKELRDLILRHPDQEIDIVVTGYGLNEIL